MKKYKEIIVVLSLLLVNPVEAVGLVNLTYPTHLPYNQGEQAITIRKLPFAVRGSHPEYIGSVLSAAYVVPHIDSAKLPKNINLISACGVKITTMLDASAKKEKGVPVVMSIDISKFAKPDYVPFKSVDIVNAMIKAVRATIEQQGCRVTSLTVKFVAGQEAFKKLIESSIPTK